MHRETRLVYPTSSPRGEVWGKDEKANSMQNDSVGRKGDISRYSLYFCL